MLKLDNDLLKELGLGGLPEEQKRAMLQHIYDTLELRVGTNLANQMTDKQLEEFEEFIDDDERGANQAQALQWLEANLPNYKQVVNDVFEALKMEIKQMAPQIMAASMPLQVSQQDDSQNQKTVAADSASPSQPNPAPLSPAAPAPRSVGGTEAYQFPTQQPPAGPGNYQQPPR